ncbi:peptide deformylase [Salinarimonas sp.]|uniref:peptide deformylase n=1 Tax=Salinarimonas sp. TaxID=2766526 RepID=UPI0032D8D2E4
MTSDAPPPPSAAMRPATPAATLPILRFGDPRLERVCAPVPLDADPALLAAQAEAMLATIHAFRARHGWGRAIAAPQVGILSRIVALAIDGVETVMLDPEIVWRSDARRELWDDCMSLPEIAVRVLRRASVTVRYRDLSGREAAFERASPDLSELLQHELDHLDGVLMTRRMSPGTPIVAHENRALALAPSPHPEE